MSCVCRCDKTVHLPPLTCLGEPLYARPLNVPIQMAHASVLSLAPCRQTVKVKTPMLVEGLGAGWILSLPDCAV